MSENPTRYDPLLAIRRVRPILDDIHWSMYGEWPPLGHDYAEQLPYLKFFVESPADLATDLAAPHPGHVVVAVERNQSLATDLPVRAEEAA